MDQLALEAGQPLRPVGVGPAGPRSQLLALLLGPGLMYAVIIWWSYQGFIAPREDPEQSYALYSYLYGIFLYFVVGGGLLSLLLYLLCRQRFADLQLQAGSLGSDLLHAIALLLVLYLVIDPVFNLARPLIDSMGLETTNLEQMTAPELQGPLLVFVSLGPYNWLAAAVFEELLRVFLLSRLWLLSRSNAMVTFSIVLAAALFGLCHLYQGLSGVVHNTLLGLLAALYYWRYGRYWPLVLMHGIYGTIALLSWYAWTAAQAVQ